MFLLYQYLSTQFNSCILLLMVLNSQYFGTENNDTPLPLSRSLSLSLLSSQLVCIYYQGKNVYSILIRLIINMFQSSLPSNNTLLIRYWIFISNELCWLGGLPHSVIKISFAQRDGNYLSHGQNFFYSNRIGIM